MSWIFVSNGCECFPAYVCGERSGLIPEDLSSMTKMENETINFNFILEEKNMVEEKLNELKAEDASKEVITNTMKDFGIERFLGLDRSYITLT
jgi:fatty acyl-CoA reductase